MISKSIIVGQLSDRGVKEVEYFLKWQNLAFFFFDIVRVGNGLGKSFGVLGFVIVIEVEIF